MKVVLVFLTCLFCLNSFGQKFDKNAIYFVGRGTLSKKELIGDRFNLYNKDLTHIGLGLVTNDTLYIYNVSSDKKDNNSSLIIEEVSDFKNVNDIFYMGIWEYKCNGKIIKKIKNEIKKLKTQQISFDRKFNLSDDNQLYCSEFVYKITSLIKELNFKPSVKELNKIEQQFLGVKSLTYIPVDFFLANENIIKLKIEYIN